MTTGTKSQAAQPAEYLETLDNFNDLDGELLPVFTDRWFSTAREVADAISEVAPDAAQDTRFWLLSAMQRNLITRQEDGRFELTDHGRSALKQPA